MGHNEGTPRRTAGELEAGSLTIGLTLYTPEESVRMGIGGTIEQFLASARVPRFAVRRR